MEKKFVRDTFPKLIDFLFLLSIAAVAVAAALSALGASYGGLFSAVIAFLITFCIGIVGVIVSFGVVYTLLDIRDTLLDIRNSPQSKTALSLDAFTQR